MKNIKKIILIGAVVFCGSLMMVSGETTNKNDAVELMLPKNNPILQQIREQSISTPVNIQQIPTVSAVDVQLLIDNNGNITAMAMVNPVTMREQVKAKTFRQRTADHMQQNWGKWLFGTLSFATVDRVAANNDWLWYDWFGSSSKSSSTPKQTGNWNITTTGDNNTININNNQPSGTSTVTNPESSAGSPVDNSDHSNNSTNGGS